MKHNIVYFSELRSRGGGYSAITEGLCTALAALGHEVRVLAFGYEGEEHALPFSVIPLLDDRYLGIQLESLVETFNPDTVAIALDLPHHQSILNYFKGSQSAFYYAGIFPADGAPIADEWIEAVNRMQVRLTLSEFSVRACSEKGSLVRMLPVPATPRLLSPPDEEREKMRVHVGFNGRYVILKIADNTDRKNWPDTIDFFARWASPEDVLVAVTRPDNQWGYNLDGLIAQHGGVRVPTTDVWEFDSGAQIRILANLRRHDLAWLLNVSDVLLQDTAAEGLSMPILEAFAVKLPVVGMDHTAISELLADQRGILFPPGHFYVDHFGNTQRWRPDYDSWAAAMDQAKHMPAESKSIMTLEALGWLRQRSWNSAAETLIEEIESE